MRALKPLQLGYLQVGNRRHGVNRYARRLAAASRGRGEEVIEVHAQFEQSSRELDQAADRLSQAEVVHVQWSPYGESLWGAGWTSARRVGRFLDRVRAPIVATLHDLDWVNPFPVHAPSLIGQLAERFAPFIFSGQRGVNSQLALIGRRASSLFVFAEAQLATIAAVLPVKKVDVIPHIVPTPNLPDRTVARGELGLGPGPVLTVLGFITPQKGHQLLLEAIAQLPADAQILFAGGDALGMDEGLAKSLAKRAEALGVASRVRVTGYLPRALFEKYLVATDVAICAFSEATSAPSSGTLADWIGAQRPIVISCCALADYCDALVPGALTTFAPYESGQLALAIRHVLAHAPLPERLATLGALHSPGRIADLHHPHYAAAAGRTHLLSQSDL